jgi:predicted phosphodiesterase
MNLLLSKFWPNDYDNIFYVLGNHEFYDNNKLAISDTVEKYRDFVSHTNIVLLNNEVYTMEDGYRIAGCTLWSNITPMAYSCMSDKYTISYKNYLSENKKSIDFLRNVNDVDMIITHHVPTYELMDNKYKHSIVNSAFYNDGIVDKQGIVSNGIKCKIWIYGHTHTYSDRMINNTRYVCNPYGYPGENTNINDKIIIT